MRKLICLSTFTLLLFVQLNEVSKCNGQDLVGGLWADERPASMEVRRIISAIKPQITDKIKSKREGVNFHGILKPVSYKLQVVNGLNYFIKIRAKIVKKFAFYHVRVHKDFAGVLTFVSLQGPLRTHDEIQFF